MKNIKNFITDNITESTVHITLKQLQDAVYSGSFMNDRSSINIDDMNFIKIKPDGWQKQSLQSHALGGIYTSKELLDIIKKSKNIDLSNIIYK